MPNSRHRTRGHFFRTVIDGATKPFVYKSALPKLMGMPGAGQGKLFDRPRMNRLEFNYRSFSESAQRLNSRTGWEESSGGGEITPMVSPVPKRSSSPDQIFESEVSNRNGTRSSGPLEVRPPVIEAERGSTVAERSPGRAVDHPSPEESRANSLSPVDSKRVHEPMVGKRPPSAGRAGELSPGSGKSSGIDYGSADSTNFHVGVEAGRTDRSAPTPKRSETGATGQATKSRLSVLSEPAGRHSPMLVRPQSTAPAKATSSDNTARPEIATTISELVEKLVLNPPGGGKYASLANRLADRLSPAVNPATTGSAVETPSLTRHIPATVSVAAGDGQSVKQDLDQLRTQVTQLKKQIDEMKRYKVAVSPIRAQRAQPERSKLGPAADPVNAVKSNSAFWERSHLSHTLWRSPR